MKSINLYLVTKSTYFLVILLISIGSSDLIAQRRYITSKGLLIINTNLDEKAVTLNSTELLISLNYENGRIVMKQEVNTLLTESDTMQSLIDNIEGGFIRFEGKLGLDYINTSGHPPIHFQIEGLMYPSNKYVMGSGTLVHVVQGSSSACLISLNFKLKYNEFFSGKQYDGKSDYLIINIKESLMARETE